MLKSKIIKYVGLLSSILALNFAKPVYADNLKIGASVGVNTDNRKMSVGEYTPSLNIKHKDVEFSAYTHIPILSGTKIKGFGGTMEYFPLHLNRKKGDNTQVNFGGGLEGEIANMTDGENWQKTRLLKFLTGISLHADDGFFCKFTGNYPIFSREYKDLPTLTIKGGKEPFSNVGYHFHIGKYFKR